jgi:hypothetical protein
MGNETGSSKVSVKSIDNATLSTGPSEAPSACVTCEENWIEIQYVSSIPQNMPKHMEIAELKAEDIMPAEAGMAFIITDVDQTTFRKVSAIDGNKPVRVFLPKDHEEVIFTFEGDRPSEVLGVPEAEKPGKNEEGWFEGLGRGVVSGSIRGINAFLGAVNDFFDWYDDNIFSFGAIQYKNEKGEWEFRALTPKEYKEMRDRGHKSGFGEIPNIDRPTSTVGKMTEGISQFLIGFIPAVRGVRILAGTALTSTGRVVQFTVAGAVADATVFDPQEERLSNLIQQFPELQNPVSEYLASSPEDTNAEGRLKNALEGMLFGAVLDGFLRSLRAMKYGVTRMVVKLQSKHRYVFQSETLAAVADVLLRAARKVEAKVTALLQEIASKANEKMAILRLRLMSPESLERKIKSDAAKNSELYSVTAAKIKDVPSYTIVFPEKDYTQSVQATLDMLHGKGYKGSRDAKGVHQDDSAVKTPQGMC